MKGQKPRFVIAIVLLCSTSRIDRPAAAQTIVPTDDRHEILAQPGASDQNQDQE